MGIITQTNEQYYVGSESFSWQGISNSLTFSFEENLKLGQPRGYIPTSNQPLNLTPDECGSWTLNYLFTNNPLNTFYNLNNFFLEIRDPSSATNPWEEFNGSTYNGVPIPGITDNTYFKLSNNVISFLYSHSAASYNTAATDPIPVGWHIRARLKSLNYGNYAYISVDDIINNFLIAYVGTNKLIPSVSRTDVMFHAQRGLQEFSYDTLKSIRSQELEIPPSLSIAIPQDYVNYVKISRIDKYGVKHIIYPTTLTSNPTELPIQDSNGIPTQDLVEYPDGHLSGANSQASQSLTEERWKAIPVTNPLRNYYWWNERSGFYELNYGRRYGLNPSTSQVNGWFTINERLGKFSFSSNLVNQIIILEYISDGLAYDGDMRVPKMAEEAMYMHIAYSILASRTKQPEYVVQRFKKDRRAALRNAKIRLSNIKLDEIIQVMRGKSKQIK